MTLQEKLYNEASNQTDFEFGRNVRIKRIYDIIYDSIDNVKNKKILDVGCWTGDIIEKFVYENKCFGVDISENAIGIARNRGIDAYKINFDKDKFPFDNECFDIILCSEVLEHIIDQDFVLKNIYNALKRDGSFVCTIPNINTPVSWFIQIFLDLPPKNSARYKSVHYRDFTYRLARKMLELNGFKIIKTYGTFIYPSTCYISQKIANYFPRLSENFVFICKKGSIPTDVPEIVFNIKELFDR